MKKLLKKLGIAIITAGVIYLMLKIALRPVNLPEIDPDPTGKIWIEEQKQIEYEKYMEERGLPY